jgi:hypothetical protein
MTMQDFLTFQTFITPTLLILLYYVGAVLIPLLSWYLARWIKRSYFSEVSGIIKEEIDTRTTSKQRFIVLLAFLFCFLCMEILWRVLFEFFIAYFDMHDALMQLKSNK